MSTRRARELTRGGLAPAAPGSNGWAAARRAPGPRWLGLSEAALAALAIAASPATAETPKRNDVAHHRRVVAPPLVDVDLLVDGAPLPKRPWFPHPATRRPAALWTPPPESHRRRTFFVPVRRVGSEYVIRIRNRHHRAIEAVLSVDGLSVINGRRASDSIRGYLVQAGQTIEIPGWRRGADHVAAFTFSTEESSYAYLTGRPSGIGIIRLTAFEEKSTRHPPLVESPQPRAAQGQSEKFSSREASARSTRRGDARTPDDGGRIGTGYGRELRHEVSRVPFERSGVRHVVTLHYGRPRFARPRGDGSSEP